MRKSIAYTTTALAFAGALAVVSPAWADEMQVSGPEIITQVEAHLIPAADGSGQIFGVAKWVGALSLPGLFDSAQEIAAEAFQIDAKRREGEVRGSLFLTNNDGTLTGSYEGKLTSAMNEKGQPKGSAQGTVEMTDGTGRFANVRGHGTWTGTFELPSAHGQWNLTITGFEKRASTQ